MHKQPKILLVEDEKNLSDVIELNLSIKGYDVTKINDGEKALKNLETSLYDLILLDIMLPHVDGFEICKKVRETNTETQILFLSAKDTTADKVQGFKLGADDYLPKPFDLEELMLRVESLLRRNINFQNTKEVYEFGRNTVNFTNYMASNGEKEFQLTKREADILEMLIEKEGEVVSRDDILKKIWGYEVVPNTRTIDNFILALRKYFEEDPKNPDFFQSVWGVGYRFVNNKT